MNGDFWRDKSVFVTGHTGFKGSWLCLWLQALGAQVSGYALPPPTQPSLFEVARVGSGIAAVQGDVQQYEPLLHAMRQAKPEIVFHLAAQPLVRLSYRNPVETYATNVLGTVHLFEAVRQCEGVRAVVNVTTDKCYANKEWCWGYRENDALGGHDPYSSSKACSELVTAAYRSSFSLPVATARAGNVIGGGDWAEDRLIPDFIRALATGEKIRIRSPLAIRPWQHVLEPLSGYLRLAELLYTGGPAYAEEWNFGPEDADARPVEWIVQRLCSLWGDGAGYALDQAKQPHEAGYLKLDCAKAKSRLGWQPRWNLEDALESIVSWMRAYRQGEDMRQVCLRQIQQFEASGR